MGTQPYPGKLNVFAFGANLFNGAQYSGKSVPNLAFANSDARRFVTGLKTFVAPLYASNQIVENDGKNTTRDKILDQISSLAEQTNEADTLVLFFASHGATTQSGFSLLLPSTDPKGDAVELPFSLVAAALKRSKGRTFVLLDACHSAGATQDAGSDQLAAIDQNITILTASKGQQSSLENAAWGGGAFTTALLANLSDSYKSLAQLGAPMSIELLYANVRRSVSAQTHEQQTPWLRRST